MHCSEWAEPTGSGVRGTTVVRNLDEPDVLVAGLGPVGAVLTALLAGHGLRVVAVDKDPGPYSLPRAIAADDETLRVLGRLPGLRDLPDLLNGVQRAAFLAPDHRVLAEMAFGETALGWPGLAFFHQPDLERALREALEADPGVELRTGTEVHRLDQDRTGVTATLAGGQRLRARYAVACDGAASPIRHQLGIRYRGRTFAQQWLVVDLACPPQPHLPYFSYLVDPARPSVNMPKPGGHRFEWMVMPGDDEREIVSAGSVAALLAPWFPDGLDGIEVLRSVVYTFHARTADRWRDGRVLLAGDAAHTMPPFAGQGLGAGVRDAAALAWRLAEVVQGVAGEDLLDDYERERRPHAKRMTDVALLLGAILQPRSAALARVVRGGIVTTNRLPVLGPVFRGGGFRPRPKGALPNPRVRTLDGRVLRLDDLLPAGRWALLGHAADPVAGLEGDALLWAKHREPATLAVVRPGGLRAVAGLGCAAVEDLDGTLLPLWKRPDRIAVVRPDRVVRGMLSPTGAGLASGHEGGQE
jgi:3-(3-hydroxy-phenyl)propionate hydroxylase